jgi:hypothetical protein
MKRPDIVIAHIVAWSIYVLLYSTLWREQGDTFQAAILQQLWLLPPKLFLVYTALLVLIPVFLLRRRYLLFFTTLVVVSFISGIFNQAWVMFIGLVD